MLLVAAPLGARASLMLTPPPNRPKDFTLLKKDGQFHLFYIRHDTSLPDAQTEKDFGHATSYDMYAWTQQPTVLPVRDTSWDNFHVWAPSIVLLDGVYYMFYTGVTQRPDIFATEQRIGVATSTDLMTWNRLDEPIYSCRDVPWAWCDTLNPSNGFRDPFIMPDPANPGHWLMYYSTFPLTDTGGMIVGVASSSGDLTHWTDLEPLWITNRLYTTYSIFESPHLFQHGDLWFLVGTLNAGQPLSYFVTHDPTGDPSAWQFRWALGTMLGIDTRSWYASEYFRDGTHDIFGFVNYNRIEMYQMLWTAPDAFQLYEPGNFHIVSLTWSQSPTVAGNTTTLSVVATGWTGQSVQLQAAEALPGGGEAPLSIDALGIPSSLPLTADTTAFVWTSNILHADGTTTGSESIVVRTTDLTAAASPLEVDPVPPPFRIAGLSWDKPAIYAGGTATLRVAATGWKGHSVGLGAAEHTVSGMDSALTITDLGLPASVPLTGDTTQVPWVARIRRFSGDTATTEILRLSTADDSVWAGPLYVTPGETSDPTGGGTDPTELRLHFRLLSSSVFGHASAFLIDLPHPARVRLDVYDLQGRRVRTLVDRELPAGANVMPWDGRDANGASAERGLYFARLITPGLTRTVKVVLTRPGGAP